MKKVIFKNPLVLHLEVGKSVVISMGNKKMILDCVTKDPQTQALKCVLSAASAEYFYQQMKTEEVENILSLKPIYLNRVRSVAEAMEEYHHSPCDAAHFCNVSIDQLLWALEGDHKTSYDTLKKIAKAYQLDLATLYNDFNFLAFKLSGPQEFDNFVKNYEDRRGS